MSKFSKALTHTFTGERKSIPKRFTIKFDSKKEMDPGYAIGTRMKLSAEIAAVGFVDESTYVKGLTPPEVIDQLKRALVEELFGEFRPYFIELSTAMYEYDFDRMRTVLAQFEHQMFVDS